MKNLLKIMLATSCLTLLLMACKGRVGATSNENQEPETAALESIPVKMMSGYFLKNSYQFQEDIACFIFTDQASFDTYLGVGRTMNNQPDQPDFAQNTLAAIACKPADVKTDIAVTKSEIVNGNTVNIHFEIKKGEKLTYTMQPLALFSFEKKAGIRTVNFIENGKTVKEITLNRRAAGAPQTIDDLKKILWERLPDFCLVPIVRGSIPN